jgi:ribosomal protein L12E/L44/L45/RPP1/RPP2
MPIKPVNRAASSKPKGRPKNGTLGEPRKQPIRTDDARRRSPLQRAFDLEFLARELPTATNVDGLLTRYNARVVEARAALLMAQRPGLDLDEAVKIAQRQAVSRNTLEREIAQLQAAAENSAIQSTREWLDEAIRSKDRNRLVLRQIREMAEEEFRARAPGDRDPRFLAIAAATVPAESRLLNEILGHQGIRDLPIPSAVELEQAGADVRLVLEMTRNMPDKGGQLVHVLGQLLMQNKRQLTAGGGGKEQQRAVGGSEIPVHHTPKRLGEGEAN